MNKITVNDTQMVIREYKGHRIVSLWKIAEVHDVPAKNIRNNFESNIKRLVEGEDYFFVENDKEFMCILNTDSKNKSAISRAKNVPVFTETGYLMMVKPMQDDKSWNIQRTLINSYFKVKEQVKEEVEEEIPIYTNNLDGFLINLFGEEKFKEVMKK